VLADKCVDAPDARQFVALDEPPIPGRDDPLLDELIDEDARP
jgi:hypothetical protein